MDTVFAAGASGSSEQNEAGGNASGGLRCRTPPLRGELCPRAHRQGPSGTRNIHLQSRIISGAGLGFWRRNSSLLSLGW